MLHYCEHFLVVHVNQSLTKNFQLKKKKILITLVNIIFSRMQSNSCYGDSILDLGIYVLFAFGSSIEIYEIYAAP